MNIKLLNVLSVMGFTGKILTFPVTINEFYKTLHKRLIPRPSYGVDACQKIAKRSVVGYQEAVDCYNSFPLKDKVRRTTLNSLNKTLELYAFKDILTRSPEPMIPSSRDINFDMSRISTYKFYSEFEFNSFLKGYFKSYHDAHTTYESSCYSKFIFRQPFPLYITGTKIKILEKLEFPRELVEEWLNLGINIFKYQGLQVISINYMDPFEYLKLYSNFYVGKSRDTNSRLNKAIARVVFFNGKYGLNHGSFAYTNLVPPISNVTYLLKTPEGRLIEILVPYLVQSPGNFQDSSSYYKSYCRSNSKYISILSGRKQEVPVVENTPIHQTLVKPKRSKRDINKETLLETKLLSAHLVEENVGVLVIPSFKYDDKTWEYEIHQSFNTFKSRKVKKLILELSNNGGGWICHGYDLLFSLFPNSTQFLNDMRSSPLQSELSKFTLSEYFSPLYHSSPSWKKISGNEAFSINEVHHRGNNHEAKFTPKFKLRCPKKIKSFPINFKPDNIVIVTNSICYSTCALLVNSLQELYNVTTYVIGGDPTLPTSPASVAGGAPMYFKDLISQIKKAKLTKFPHSPKPLPAHVSFKFLQYESYSHHHPNRPLEFTFLPAHYHLSYTNLSFNYPEYIWSHIAKKMKKSKPKKASSRSNNKKRVKEKPIIKV